MCPPHDNPFPTLDTSPSASQEALNAEIARATARENEIASGIVPAVTAAASGIEQSIRNDLSGVTSGIAATAATAMSNSQQAVTAANQARQVANAAESTAAARAATVASGIAASVATSTAESVVENSLDRIDYEYDRKLGQFARKEYVDACLKQAVVMTQSPDGLSQIQIGNDGVPKVIIKTITATHENQGTVSWHGTTWTFGWTPDDIDELNAAVWEEVSSTSYPWYNSLGTNGELAEGDELFVGTPPSGSASWAASHHYHIVLVKKASDGTRNLWVLMEPQGGASTHWSWGLASSLSPTLHPAPEESRIDTMYLVTEETLGSLEARIAALEAAQS